MKYDGPAGLQGSVAPALSASMSRASPLGDRTNKIASSRLPVPAVYRQQPKGTSSDEHQGLTSSQEAAYAVPADENGDEGEGLYTQQKAMPHVRHESARGCVQQDDISIHAHTEAQMLADRPLEQHEAEVDLRMDTGVQVLSVSDSAHTLEDSVQKARMGQSSPDGHHCSSAVHEPVFVIAACGTRSTRHATDTVSPGRRVFAAQVTVTRPTTPASPASAVQ